MSKHASPTIIGAFVLVAIALVIAAVFVIGGGTYFHKKTRAIVYFERSVNGLRIGAPVKFRGIDIGAVKDIRINMRGAVRDPSHVRIPVVFEIDLDRVKEEGVPEIHLESPTVVKMLVRQGLRAQLETESLVTGVLYVALDVLPDTPARIVGDTHYPEIPPARTSREEIPAKVQDILTKLAAVDVERLADSLQSTVDHADKLLQSPELERAVTRLDAITQRTDKVLGTLDGLTRQLSPAVAELGQTAVTARKTLMPAGTLATQLAATLQDIQSAARSLRRLADHLNRDPGAVLRGGKSS
jgi:paraquat-inducible protein B